MDAKHFDNWTKRRAVRLTRRDALKAIGVAGAAAALPANARESAAQGNCTLTLHAETGAGPSAPTAYDGELAFSLGPNGALSQATFTPVGGSAQPVSGVVTGRAIDFQIELADGEELRFSGAATQPLDRCQGGAGGLFTGPRPGDLGGWQTASDTPSTATSSQSSGSTTCAPGQTLCGNTCVPNCTNGQQIDTGTCTCFTPQSTCLPDGSSCTFGADCCGGSCNGNNVCEACPGLVCGDMGCVDHLSDPNNCGTCGTVCVDDTGFCLNGSCQCIPDDFPSGSSSSSCCSQGMITPDGRCGCSAMGEWCSAGGQCCDNAAGAVCIPGHGGFEVCCMFPGGACASDDHCCGGANETACLNGVCTKTM